MKENVLSTSVVSVGQLLQYGQLAIPVYQRPYKWLPKNVLQLLKDVYTFRSKSAYRLGTVVIHDDGINYNIVDGQQRIITLLLITRAILKHHKHKLKNPELRKLLNTLEVQMFDPLFSNEISVTNMRNNYQVIEREVVTLEEDLILFLFNRCQVIQFVLNDVSEAFQFFDSQNARGRDLEPHDLLKAFHLREFSLNEEHLKTDTINSWESLQTDELSGLFADFLYRVRSWSRMSSARFFTKNETDLFKGVNLEKIQSFAYTLPLRMAHHVVDHYNNNFERKIDGNKMEYPFQLDQTIVNGRRFFEMVNHYKKAFDSYRNEKKFSSDFNDISIEILTALNEYEGRQRIGDTYVRMLFDCALLYYIDRFGHTDINRAIEKIFIWAYSVRLNYQNVQLASLDNYVVEEMNLFRIIKDATTPDELFSINIAPVERNSSTKTKDIEELFKKLKYYGSYATANSNA